MKRILIIGLFLILSLSVFSQSVYFDIGVGVGQATTMIGTTNMASAFGSSVTEAGVDLSLKLGYGPISGVPFYIVGEIGGIGHRFQDSTNYIQFNSYLIGPGIIFYPNPLIQLGASVGYSYVANQTDLPMTFYQSESGIAGNVSVAVDLGKKNNGLLIGLKYAVSKNTLKTSGAEQTMSLISGFLKYAYRQKSN